MQGANARKLCEAGKAELEQFDVSEAIAQVRRLGEGLIEATKHAKHHFRREWLEQLVQRYKERPGKPVIHLDDLDDAVIAHLATEVREILRPHWRALVSRYGYEWSFTHFRCLRDILATGRATRWSRLSSWRELSELTGMRVNELEPYVVAIRVSHVGTSRVILSPKLLQSCHAVGCEDLRVSRRCSL